MDQIACAERYVRGESVREVPEVTKPCGLRCQVAKVLVAPVKRAAVKPYLHQKVLESHSHAVAMGLTVEAPVA